MYNKLYTFDTTELDNPGIYDYWYGKMNAARRKKVDAYRFDKDKKLSLAAGILLHRALEEIGITAYETCESDRGKPFIKGHEDVFFNLSHSGRMAALGISDREIGIDIEKRRRFEDTLIRYVFTASEIDLAKRLAEGLEMSDEGFRVSDRDNSSSSEHAAENPEDIVYTRFWTVKESIMKHSGKGIGLEPKKIILALKEAESFAPGIFSFAGVEPLREILPGLTASCEDYDCAKFSLTTYGYMDYQLSVCSEY